MNSLSATSIQTVTSDQKPLASPPWKAGLMVAFGAVLGASSWKVMAATAPTFVETAQVRAELLASAGTVHAGQQLTIGLHQRIVPHWHTYWINPGDSGLATTIEWTLPPGAQAGAIQWPAPHRFTQGPVTNFGYENEVTLLSDIKVPDKALPGKPFVIDAKVNWLVCREVCIPQEAHLSLTLPVVAAGIASGEEHALIAQARAQLPVVPAWNATAEQRPGGLALRIPNTALNAKAITDIWFYPAEWGRIAHNAQQPRRVDGANTFLQLDAGETPAQAGQALTGVLVVTEGSGANEVRRSYAVSTAIAPGSVVNAAPPINAGDHAIAREDSVTLGSALVLALLGGLVLNLMPCVFPVLSIKALALLKHSEQTPAQARLHGLAYTAGVLGSFALLGALLIALKAGGSQVGWGFQFQSPVFVLAVAYLMFAVGLSLSGVFTVGNSVAGLGSSLANRSGYVGSFFTGVLATIVATPCTAPFMGGAIGFALGQPAAVLMAVFLSLGLGLALPYLILSLWPRLQSWLPRPGIWMERVKQGLAFPMYAAAAWLVWVLAQQARVDAVAVALIGMVAIGFAAWSYASSRLGSARVQRIGLAAAALAVISAVAGGYLGIQADASATPVTNHAEAPTTSREWEPYSSARFDELRSKGQPVFVNLTAAWCITCLVNERVALSKPTVLEAFKASDVTYLKGDWTKQDPQISKLLAEFGRSGVPLYVLYPQGLRAKPVVLPQVLTPEVVIAAVKDAAASTLSPR
jgi:thiol:disulfide interchange protein/DsbC/DsbD-like thiol-disulfide interchange protein